MTTTQAESKGSKRGATHTSTPEKLAYTVEEAVHLSTLGLTSIYKAIRAGQLKSRKFGPRTLIMHSDLMSFLNGLPVETK